MDKRYTESTGRRFLPTGRPPLQQAPRAKGPRPRPNARVCPVTIKLSAAQVARFEAACEAAGLPRSKAGAVAIVRWYQSVLGA